MEVIASLGNIVCSAINGALGFVISHLADILLGLLVVSMLVFFVFCLVDALLKDYGPHPAGSVEIRCYAGNTEVYHGWAQGLEQAGGISRFTDAKTGQYKIFTGPCMVTGG